MKTKSIIPLLLGCLFLFTTPLFAQKAKHKNHKAIAAHHPGHRKAGKPCKYPRNRVVVIKHRKVHTMAVLPAGYTTIYFKKRDYFHHNGFYYTMVGANYTIVNPPVGLRIKLLPMGHKKVIIAGAPHYYYMGSYYKQVESEYEIVNPAVGTVVTELPENNVDEITIDGQSYYEMDGMVYKTIDTEKGRQYEVVGKLG